MKLLDYLTLEPSILLNSLQREFGGTVTEHSNGLYSYYLNRGGEILGVAHCDTVAKGMLPMPKRGNGTINTIALDDRLGVYALFCGSIRGNYDILITDGEESGQSTAQFFHPDVEYNWMFEVDRRGTDAVCYQYADFEPIVSDWFPIGMGSYSDISSLEHLGIMGVNIGIGYYQEHSTSCFAVWDHFNEQLAKLSEMISKIGTEWQPFNELYSTDSIPEELEWVITVTTPDSLTPEDIVVYAEDNKGALDELAVYCPDAEVLHMEQFVY